MSMLIQNFREKGLYEHGLNLEEFENKDFGFYVTENQEFFVRPSIWDMTKWVIIPSSPETSIKINHERFTGDEKEVLNKLKEWI